jgi:hypothetical protein
MVTALKTSLKEHRKACATRMFEQISNLISALEDAGALSDASVINTLAAFARCLEDQDYRSHMLGELSIRVAAQNDFDEAEQLARSIVGSEKVEFLRRVAEIEAGNQRDRALRLFLEARDAVPLHRFPTQQAQALSDIAESLETAALQVEALNTWNLAVDLAKSAQHRKGTDGPEAAGVLLKAVETFCKAGKIDTARFIAEAIIFDDLRERALRIVAEF